MANLHLKALLMAGLYRIVKDHLEEHPECENEHLDLEWSDVDELGNPIEQYVCLGCDEFLPIVVYQRKRPTNFNSSN
jgi:hypothetical protein